MHMITLELDDIDYKTVIRAMAQRERNAPNPETKSNTEGATVAEICRGWIEFMDSAPPIDSGDEWKMK